MADEYWGAYCPQCNVWLLRDNGDPFFYPAPEIMQAILTSAGETPWVHLWEVTKFGSQKSTESIFLPVGSPVCPGSAKV